MREFQHLIMTYPGKIFAILGGFLVLAIFFQLNVNAADPSETIVVTDRDSFETSKLDIGADGRADLRVYLKSGGEVVDGYKISLVDNETRKVVKTLLSDAEGKVVYGNLGPGTYTVVLRRTEEQKRNSSVLVGSLVLRPSKAQLDSSTTSTTQAPTSISVP